MTLDELKEIRLSGKRPLQAVIVSTMGYFYSNPTITAKRDQDWRPLHDLNVIVTYHKDLPFWLLKEILLVSPRYLETQDPIRRRNNFFILGGKRLWN